jgi:uncharacterized membrane protein
MERAAQVGDEIATLGEKHELTLLDIAVAVRYGDGSLTLNGEPLRVVTEVHRGTIARLLACLALGAPPLCGPAVGVMYTRFGTATKEVDISDEFVREVETLIKPGTSVLFVLDQGGDMDAILHAIRGQGGTVLKTNVDLEHARLIQSTLSASVDATIPQD